MVKKIAVISHRQSAATRDAFAEVLELCRELGVEAVVPEHEVEKHSLEDARKLAKVVDKLDGEGGIEFCVALGGDGTILRAFNRFPDMQTPVLGINFGRIGFLSAIAPEQVTDRLRSILEGDYKIMKLSLIEMDNAGQKALAVNDIVVHKPEGGSVVRLSYGTAGSIAASGDAVADAAGVEFESLSCDGMVLATPAGSTAYNLSNGGPLLSLSLDAMVLSAIAPHTLCFRALVLGPGEQLFIRNETMGKDTPIYIDGRATGAIAPGGSIDIRLSPKKARLVQLPDADFHRTLRDRFIQPG